jgi:hypothetical protein
MQAITTATPIDVRRYAKTIEASKRIRWDIDRDVIRGRHFDLRQKFLPDGLSLIDEIDGLSADQRRFLGQVQGRTYAHMFGLVERFIGAKMLEVSRDHWLGDQTALEAIVRFTDEELKHQELFRRVERLVAADMPDGYRFDVSANDVASFVLGKSTWAVLALTCHIELFSQAHYRESIAEAEGLSDLFKDIFLFHWKEESQHAVIDELEWAREDAKLPSDAARDAAVDDLIRAGRRRRRHPARPGRSRHCVLPARRRHRRGRSARRGGRGDGAEGLPLAVHRLRRDPPALPEGAQASSSATRRWVGSRPRWRP